MENKTLLLLYVSQKMMQSWAASAIFGHMHHKEETVDLQREKKAADVPWVQK